MLDPSVVDSKLFACKTTEPALIKLYKLIVFAYTYSLEVVRSEVTLSVSATTSPVIFKY
jgi:hypothetical protein